MGDPIQAAILLSLAALSLVAAVYFGVILQRMVSARRWLPTLATAAREQGPSGNTTQPESQSVCVIIPAHNEASVIAEAVRTVLPQEVDDLRLVLVLDRCTDDTRAFAEAAAAGDPRLEIIENDNCPEGWTGKNNALRRAPRSHARPMPTACSSSTPMLSSNPERSAPRSISPISATSTSSV